MANYQEMGEGNSSDHSREATVRGKAPGGNSGGDRSQGEVSGAGSMYTAMLNERPNISNPRNRGPSREPSRSASSPIPAVSASSRNTGRVTS